MNARTILVLVLLAGVKATPAEPEVRLDWKRLAPLPNAAGVAGAFAGVSGGALLVAGGANFPSAKPWEGGRKVWHDDVFVLEKPEGQWKRAGHLPRPLGYGVSASHRNEVICVGGSDAARHYAEVFALGWRNGKVSTRSLPPLPQTLANACGAIVSDTLYVAGGIATPDATNALRSFFALDLSKPETTWRELPSWPGPPRMLAVAAAVADTFFVVGGVELIADERGAAKRRYLRDGYRFISKRGWKPIASAPFPIAAAPSPAPVTPDEGFLIVGSDDGSRASLLPSPTHPGFNDAVLLYNTKSDSWSRIAATPIPRATAPTVSWRGRWVIPNGEVRPGVRSPDVWSVGLRAK